MSNFRLSRDYTAEKVERAVRIGLDGDFKLSQELLCKLWLEITLTDWNIVLGYVAGMQLGFILGNDGCIDTVFLDENEVTSREY